MLTTPKAKTTLAAKYGIEATDSVQEMLFKRIQATKKLGYSAQMLKDLKLALETRFDQQIRSVLAFEQTSRDGGGCNTCSFEYLVVQVWFKTSDGKLCAIDLDGSLQDLMRTVFNGNG